MKHTDKSLGRKLFDLWMAMIVGTSAIVLVLLAIMIIIRAPIIILVAALIWYNLPTKAKDVVQNSTDEALNAAHTHFTKHA